jgi:hypothetical protein
MLRVPGRLEQSHEGLSKVEESMILDSRITNTQGYILNIIGDLRANTSLTWHRGTARISPLLLRHQIRIFLPLHPQCLPSLHLCNPRALRPPCQRCQRPWAPRDAVQVRKLLWLGSAFTCSEPFTYLLSRLLQYLRGQDSHVWLGASI